MAPLLGWAVGPGLVVLPRCVLPVGAAVLVTGLGFGAFGQALAGLGVIASALPGAWLGRSRPSPRRPGRLLLGLVAVGAVGAVAYVAVLAAAVRAGRLDEVTWGLPHLPMQAALAVAVAACAAVAVLQRPAPGWRAGALLAGVASGCLGAVSVAYPDHLGSAGSSGGAGMVAWGAAVVVSALRTERAVLARGPSSCYRR